MSMGLGDTAPEVWNVEYPERIQKIHTDYFNAGAELILTNTFGASSIKLSKRGLEDRGYEFNAAAGQLAKEICPPGKFVAGDIGPCGEMPPPLGKVTEGEIKSSFENQVLGLQEGGIDVWIVETMISLKEAELADCGP